MKDNERKAMFAKMNKGATRRNGGEKIKRINREIAEARERILSNRITTRPLSDEITRKDFQAYENVRESGITNMFAANVVSDYSGLDRKKIFDIMKNYGELVKKYPGVRK